MLARLTLGARLTILARFTILAGLTVGALLTRFAILTWFTILPRLAISALLAAFIRRAFALSAIAFAIGTEAIAASTTAPEVAVKILAAAILNEFTFALLLARGGLRLFALAFDHLAVIAVEIAVITIPINRRRRCRLHGAQHPVIMLSVLEVILRHDPIARR